MAATNFTEFIEKNATSVNRFFNPHLITIWFLVSLFWYALLPMFTQNKPSTKA